MEALIVNNTGRRSKHFSLARHQTKAVTGLPEHTNKASKHSKYAPLNQAQIRN